MVTSNTDSARNGGLIYTTGLDKGIPIGCLREDNGNKVLVVKDHNRIDSIRVEELITILMEYQYHSV